jgi:hypothetical protein
MSFEGSNYVGDLALYYAAKKIEAGANKSIKDIISPTELYRQRTGRGRATKFSQGEIQQAQYLADRLVNTAQAQTKPSGYTEKDLLNSVKSVSKEIVEVEKQVGKLQVPPEATGVQEAQMFQNALDEVMKKSVLNTLSESGQLERDTFLNALGFNDVAEGPGIPVTSTTTDEITEEDLVVEVDDEIVDDEIVDDGNSSNGQITNTAFTQFNNIPEDALLWDVGGSFYIVYEVPGSQGELYEGNPVYMAYELKDNDLFNAGLLSQGETAPQPNATMDQAFFDSIAIVTGNTDQLTSLIDNPFASFVETVGEQSQVAPWITDPEMISLIAEAAVEGREVSDAEWQTTNWYQTHNESEREWLRTYYADPSTATQLTTDSQISVANFLQAAGVSNAPEALINWVAGKFVSGQWSETYTGEQISLFADPYATGKRDTSFENYLSSTALTGVDRTTEREREVRELYGKWLGPTLGNLNDNEVAEIAGRLRDDPEYQDQLVQSLKQSRLAAFGAYTNPELTYEDIARPWRNLTTSVWGQTADETQGWWQEMVKSNDFAQAQNTLREKGLEQDVTQVTQDATQALQQALGQGTVSQSGVNV